MSLRTSTQLAILCTGIQLLTAPSNLETPVHRAIESSKIGT